MYIFIGSNLQILYINGVAYPHIPHIQLNFFNQSCRQGPVRNFFQMLFQYAFRYFFMIAENNLRNRLHHLVLYQYLKIHFQDLSL